MSTIEALHLDSPRMEISEPRYIATVLGCPLLWDDADHCPVWPNGKPTEVQWLGENGIDVYELCDVNLVMPGVQPKRMDCGHTVRSGEPYLTFLADNLDECLPCAEARR